MAKILYRLARNSFRAPLPTSWLHWDCRLAVCQQPFNRQRLAEVVDLLTGGIRSSPLSSKHRPMQRGSQFDCDRVSAIGRPVSLSRLSH